MYLPTNQTGIVYCTPELYLGPAGAELLKHIIPLRVEYCYMRRRFELQAYSKHFDELREGEESPHYHGIFSLVEGKSTFTRFERKQ